MKIELTIKTDYLPTWGVWQGLRELVQNGRDAQTELGATMTVDHHNNVVRIENEGCVLPHEALLLGHTTKVGKDELIGRFGEGLKLGILALVRAGLPVKIRSGDEVWTPTIQRSEKFKADVLVFDVQGGRKLENRVRVEVQGIDKATWEGAKWKFRFLDSKDEASKVVETPSGALLLGENRKGCVFMKGIYVHSDPKLEYGFDLNSGELDRDRKMVERYDFMFRAKEILTAAVSQRPDLLGGFVSALERQTPDVEGITSYSTLPKNVSQAVAADFKSKHGPDAVPVRTLAESKDLDHLGKKGIVVSESLASVLGPEMPSAAAVKEALREETLARYGWHDLSAVERTNLDDAVHLVNDSKVATVSLDTVDVVDFRSPDLLGLFKDGRILLARNRVSDANTCLATLVHEVAHRMGSDGDKSHVSAIEAIWQGIVAHLRSKP
jgi:hypothetical protein